jgi:50S ribosomal protein L16 3-hydroxylase
VQFSSFDPDTFLRDHWQKAPLLIRNMWTSWTNPLEPNELAGLACEDGVEARLITQRGGNFAVEHGPFAETRFSRSEPDPWTLLVQAVDHHAPSVSALLDPFRFIPNWRIDDVMVSYATDQGGVGPHFDQYDVFLIQGLGRRRWQVGGLCDEQTERLPNDDLRLLANFEPVEEWVLEPGDVLYVPPGVAHNGIAMGDDCMTYSIGFRAPSRADLIDSWSEYMVEQLNEDDRYADPGLVAADNPGEITSAQLAQLQAMIAEKLMDRRDFGRWFGQYSTSPKNLDIDWAPEIPIEADDLLALGPASLVRNAASRLSFIREGDQTIMLFVDGAAYVCVDEAALFAQRCCASTTIAVTPDDLQSPVTVELTVRLINQGVLQIAEDD